MFFKSKYISLSCYDVLDPIILQLTEAIHVFFFAFILNTNKKIDLFDSIWIHIHGKNVGNLSHEEPHRLTDPSYRELS